MNVRGDGLALRPLRDDALRSASLRDVPPRHRITDWRKKRDRSFLLQTAFNIGST